MFTQSQILGMQTSQMMQLKDEIKMGDKVSARHPYSVHNSPCGQLPPVRFSTAFGTDIDATSRVRDRNAGAREAERALKWGMQEPYPCGYTGHVAGVRTTIGSSYGKQTRYAINRVSHAFEKPRVGEMTTSYNASFPSPSAQIAARRRDASASRPADRTKQILMSTARDEYKPPPEYVYQIPAWTERATSNIGQPDVYHHFKESTIHRPGETPLKTLRPPTADRFHTAITSPPAIPFCGSRSEIVQTSARAAGMASRPDAWLLSGRR
jgi:hypothetical protein